VVARCFLAGVGRFSKPKSRWAAFRLLAPASGRRWHGCGRPGQSTYRSLLRAWPPRQALGPVPACRGPTPDGIFFNCPLLFSPGSGMIPTIVTLRSEELRIARSRLAFGLPIPPAPPLLTAPARPALSSVPSRLVVCAAPALRGATSDGCVFPPRRPGWVSSFCGLARPFACG